ncbi:hypothetical protein LIER_28129 [Lithospermum erythrorhizon]|uniref:Retrotransposon gag domain-containing protein n=1 Tax=Lithospermum erythrorhizon TaxID=34254 RepID=A0AAV3RG83_LITER
MSNGQHKQELKHALSECKQTSTMSVADYFGKLEKLWDDLAAFNPVLACVCGMSKQFQQKLDEEIFLDFLYGINREHYGHLRSQLLAQDPTPSLDWAFKATNKEEQLQKCDHQATPMTL